MLTHVHKLKHLFIHSDGNNILKFKVAIPQYKNTTFHVEILHFKSYLSESTEVLTDRLLDKKIDTSLSMERGMNSLI